MANCPKCQTVNEEGLTRCRACNAILPVKLGSKSEVRYERVRRQADLVGIKCPKCAATNPYTVFRCQKCGASLSQTQKKSGLGTVWVYVGLLVAGAAIVLAIMLRGA